MNWSIMEQVTQERRRDVYAESVNKIMDYLDGLPPSARRAWQEASYHSYLLDSLKESEEPGTRTA